MPRAMTITRRTLSALLLLLLAAACFVTGLTGPTTVTVGQSATYDIPFETDSSGTNGTAYVFVDVPTGWTLTNATYNATVNGSATSGSATTGVAQSGTPCVAVAAPPAGYQRLGFSATFPIVTAADSGTLHVTFTIGGPTGSYTLSAFGGGSFGGPTQQCNSNQTATLGVTVNPVAALAAPSVSKAFAPSTVAAGATSRLTITLSNSNSTAIAGAAFTDTYPSGLVNATPTNIATTCGGTASSTTNSVSLTGGTIPGNGSCTVGIDVTAASANSYSNTIASGGVTTTNAGSNTQATTAVLTVTGPVTQAAAVPTLSEWALMVMAAMLALLALKKM
jgi:uncharacterized repeat protein (TIGR01451 family)